jgi:hypothetical protein
MAQPPSRPLGLHCLLYLSAEQICPPVSRRPGGFAIQFRSSKRPWFVQLLDGWEGGISLRTPWVREKRVSVPCRPTVKVSPEELGSRLLMAALLECRDAGQLRPRLADNRDWRPGSSTRSRVVCGSLPWPARAFLGYVGESWRRLSVTAGRVRRACSGT